MDSRQRYQTLFNTINQYNSGEKGITRIAYSNDEQTCTHNFIHLCSTENLSIRLDECGNVIARREGKIPGLPPVMIGSHLDTVYQGGKYDGVVGVTAALEVIRRLNEKEIETDHPIEIISFACEESSRFGVSTVGSKAMAGMIDKEKYRNLTDRDGVTMERAFTLCALDFDVVDEASRVGEDIKAFFELHVEQGPILINDDLKIGIVTGIAAPARYAIKVEGTASHSGTTPMSMRKDAFLGASEIALQLEEKAKEEKEHGTVATVGVVDIEAGAMNVVPGTVDMKVDIRSTSVESRQRVVEALYEMVNQIESKRNLHITIEEISGEEPVLLSEEINQTLEEICREKQLPYTFMPSGAGHDAMNMTRLCPTALIFIPSVDGLSHHPDEYTELDDIMNGIDVLEEAIIRFASSDQPIEGLVEA